MVGELRRLIAAFLLYRWWSLLGHLRSRRGSDGFGRLVRGLEPVARLLVVIMILPTALLILGLGVGVGWGLGTGKLSVDEGFVLTLRLVLFGLTVTAMVGPLIIGTADGRAELGRLLLLPISRVWLYGLRYVSTLVDFWHVATGLLAFSLPLGLAVGRWGQNGTGLWELLLSTLTLLVAGVLFLLANAALGFWVFLLVQRVLADRRRAEALVLGGLMLLMMIGFGVIWAGDQEISEAALSAAFGLNPLAEPYVSVLRGAVEGRALPMLTGSGFLAVLLVILAGLGRRAHDQLLLTGRQSKARSGRDSAPAWEPKLWGLSPAASAVAWVQVKTLWRTVPGKMAMAQTPFMVVLGGTMLPQSASFLRPQAGLNLALVLLVVGVTFGLMGVLQFSFNSFAIDRAGASLQILLPIRSRDLLRGKAAAWVLWVTGSLGVSIPLALALAWPGLLGALGGSLLMLLATLSGLALFVPAGLCASAILPKQVNLGKAIQGNQPHALAGFFSLLMLLPSWGIPLLIIALAGFMWNNVGWALIGLGVWLGISLAVGWVLMLVAESTFEGRREGILLEIQGR